MDTEPNPGLFISADETAIWRSFEFETTCSLLLDQIARNPLDRDTPTHVAAVVVLATAAMEETANLFLVKNRRFFGSLYPCIEKLNVAQKAAAFAEMVHRSSLDPGAEPLQSFNDLVALRNAIVHSKPKPEAAFRTQCDIEDTENSLVQRFKKREFGPSTEGEPEINGWYITKHIRTILRPQCAKWAVELVKVYDRLIDLGFTHYQYTSPDTFKPIVPTDFDEDTARLLVRLRTESPYYYPPDHCEPCSFRDE